VIIALSAANITTDGTKTYKLSISPQQDSSGGAIKAAAFSGSGNVCSWIETTEIG
jgi:hypothetical protein